jgi:hypothetical protein
MTSKTSSLREELDALQRIVQALDHRVLGLEEEAEDKDNDAVMTELDNRARDKNLKRKLDKLGRRVRRVRHKFKKNRIEHVTELPTDSKEPDSVSADDDYVF